MSEMTIALLPIHPEYANAILDGLKKVEFRKRLFKKDVQRILIYACHPVMSLVGYFDVDDITETTPKNIFFDIPKPIGMTSPGVNTLSSRVCFNQVSKPCI